MRYHVLWVEYVAHTLVYTRYIKSVTYVWWDEDAGHCVQGLFRPGEEPVYTGVVHHPREVPAARSQSVTNWGHGHHQMQVVGTLVDKVLPDAFSGWSWTGVLGFVTHLNKYIGLIYNWYKALMFIFIVSENKTVSPKSKKDLSVSKN